METRSKAQRDAGEADATGSGPVISETEIRSARDPSPPVLTPVGFRATPVLADKSPDDAGQHQEPTDLRHGLEISTTALHKPTSCSVSSPVPAVHSYTIYTVSLLQKLVPLCFWL